MSVKHPDEAAGPFTDVDGPALPLLAELDTPTSAAGTGWGAGDAGVRGAAIRGHASTREPGRRRSQQTGLVREHHATGDLAGEGFGEAASTSSGEMESAYESENASESGGLLEQLVRKALG
jgi:hypothetical protein